MTSATGSTGPSGPTGPAGSTGNTGPQGVAGRDAQVRCKVKKKKKARKVKVKCKVKLVASTATATRWTLTSRGKRIATGRTRARNGLAVLPAFRALRPGLYVLKVGDQFTIFRIAGRKA